MFKKFDGIIVDEVICYEETVKMKLPKDYKEFLLDTNGGQFIDEIHMFWVDELKENIGIDVLDVPYKQIVIAMGEGAKAALSAFDDRIRGIA